MRDINMDYYKDFVNEFAEKNKFKDIDRVDALELAHNVKLRDMMSGRIVWYNHLFWDYYLYLKNNHVVLSIFMTDPDHPFSRKERGKVFFCAMSMAFFVSAITGEEDGALILSFVFGIMIWIYIRFLKFFATCGCVQGKETGCCKLQACLEFIGGHLLNIGILFSLLFLGLSFIFVESAEFMLFFMISQGSTWVQQVLLMSIFFLYFRRGELIALKNEFEIGYHLEDVLYHHFEHKRKENTALIEFLRSRGSLALLKDLTDGQKAERHSQIREGDIRPIPDSIEKPSRDLEAPPVMDAKAGIGAPPQVAAQPVIQAPPQVSAHPAIQPPPQGGPNQGAPMMVQQPMMQPMMVPQTGVYVQQPVIVQPGMQQLMMMSPQYGQQLAVQPQQIAVQPQKQPPQSEQDQSIPHQPTEKINEEQDGSGHVDPQSNDSDNGDPKLNESAITNKQAVEKLVGSGIKMGKNLFGKKTKKDSSDEKPAADELPDEQDN